MTENEAIEIIKNFPKWNLDDLWLAGDEMGDLVDMAIKALEEIQQYRAIGTMEECQVAVEKQTEKKPIRLDKCTCPSCGTYNGVWRKRRNTLSSDIVYCWHCGQAVEIKRGDEE